MRRSSRFLARRSSTTTPQVSRYQDHFSLQAPTSLVRFADKHQAARVIYNPSTQSQLVIEERIDPVTRQRHISIKQMNEEPSFALRILRASYTLVAAFFMGFLFCFCIQVLLLLLFDLSVYLGYTDVQENPQYVLAVGVFLSLPLLVHGFALMMMFAGFMVVDLWQGHYFFKKFVLPSCPQEIMEWVFLLGFLVIPLLVISAALFQKRDDWWEIGATYWFFSVMTFYIIFMVSVLFYEARVYFQIVRQSNIIENEDTWLGRLVACVSVRKRNTLSGYSIAQFASFGSPQFVWNTDDTESKQHIVEGTLRDNKRGLYTRFSQLGCFQGCMYSAIEPPKRIFSVDDVTGRRPYITSVTWGLEKYFCTPRKGRYVGLLNGPSAITSRQLMSALVCNFLGVFMVYIMLAAALVYEGFGSSELLFVFVIILLLTFTFWLGPIKSYWEIRKLGILKEQFRSIEQLKHMIPSPTGSKNNEDKNGEHAKEEQDSKEVRDPNNGGDKVNLSWSKIATGNATENIALEVEHANEYKNTGDVDSDENVGGGDVTIDLEEKDKATITEIEDLESNHDNLRWAAFDDINGCDDDWISRGVFHVREKHRVSEPSGCLKGFVFLLELLLCVIWPAISLYWVENWQLSTVFLAVAIVTTLRHYTNAAVLLEEMGELFTPKEDADEESAWEAQSRLSQVAGTISHSKGYLGWRFVLWLFTAALLFLSVQSRFAESIGTSDTQATLLNDFEYVPQNSLHYTACDFTQNIEGNLPVEMQDYIYMAIQAYRTENATKAGLKLWYNNYAIQDQSDIVTAFRQAEEHPSPVFYKLFTIQQGDTVDAVVSIKGSTTAWDWFTNAQVRSPWWLRLAPVVTHYSHLEPLYEMHLALGIRRSFADRPRGPSFWIDLVSNSGSDGRSPDDPAIRNA